MLKTGVRGNQGFGGSGLGRMLMEKELISEQDLATAEQHASREQMDLVDAVIATGLVDEGDAYAALAAAAGTELVSLGSRELSELAVRLVPDRIARKHLVVPLEVDDRTLTYATCRPDDAEAERDVAFATGRRTRMLVARRSDVVAAHDRCYPAVDRAVPPLPPPRQHSRQRVLIIDDEPITRMLVKLLLEKADFEVLQAANGRDAVVIAMREHPNLVLLDLNMPQMDGYEAITRMRGDPSLAAMPILVLTSEEGPGVEKRVLQLGADDYIMKPFNPDVLLSRVNAVFRRLKVVAA